MTELVRGMDDDAFNGLIHGTPESEWKTIDQGAATLVVAGFDPALDGMPLLPLSFFNVPPCCVVLCCVSVSVSRLILSHSLS
jgi:hypothetical protein